MRIIKTGKIITLSNDPWSTNLLDFIKLSPHFLTAKQWDENIDTSLESTFYFKWLMTMFDRDGTVWNGILKNKNDIINRCIEYKKMYLVTPKWDESREIYKKVENSDHYYGYRPVKVHNDGMINVWDGMHRISLLASKNLPIEVTICERLLEWNTLYKELEDLYPNKFLYQPILHPDFSDWTFSTDGRKEQIICDFFKKNKVDSVLDVGTCHGFTLYKLKDLIKKGIGIEDNITRFKIANLLLKKIGFDCYNNNAIDYIKHSEYVDCTLCLAMFHHISRLYPIEVFDEFLRTVAQKTKFLIYTLPQPNEEQFTWLYESKRSNIDEYILQTTNFKTKEIIKTNSRDVKILEKNM